MPQSAALKVFKVTAYNGVTKYFSNKRLANTAAKAYSSYYGCKFEVTQVAVKDVIEPEIARAYEIRKRQDALLRRQVLIARGETLRICSRCKQAKEASSYYKPSFGRTVGVCIACVSEKYFEKKAKKEEV